MKTARQNKLPPLPKTVPSPLGPVPVILVPRLQSENGQGLFGAWSPVTREIEIAPDCSLQTQWATLWHERIHQILFDAGVRGHSQELEERLCDVISTALVHDMLNR